MDIRKADLNLLPVFEALMKTQSVTEAGRSLGLSQPAMSYALKQLRALFGDPLFVRSQRAMLPTPRARQLARPVSAVLDSVRHEVLEGGEFDPARADRQFSLCLTDIGGIVFLPRLLERMRAIAPGITVCTSLVVASQLEAALESGEIDLAIGDFPDLPGSIYQARLYEGSYVCLVRAGHPGVGRRLTLKQYVELDHAVVRSPVRTMDYVDRALARHGLKRRVVLSVPHYGVIPAVVERLDVIATLPREIAQTLSRFDGARIVDSPVKVPNVTLRQFWHKRYNHDPANRWLRSLVSELFAE